MPAPIRKTAACSLLCLGLFLGACATPKKTVQLIDDPNAKPESNIPWNKQEKWEVGAGITSQMGQTR